MKVDMKKLTLVLLVTALVISCKSQQRDTSVTYSFEEHDLLMQRLDSANAYKEEAEYFKAIYDDIHNNGDYYRVLEFIDAKGGEFFFYNKEDYTKTIIKQEGKKYEFRLIDNNIEFWFSKWIDSVYIENNIFRLPLEILK